MMQRSLSIALALVFGVALPSFAAEKVQPVRMGDGIMTFDTVPGWGLGDDGKSVIGSTHGGVVVDKSGNIYTSSSLGVFVFSPDGKVIRRFVGDQYKDMHDLKIRDEAEGEFIYGARNNNAEGVKFNAQTGDIVMKLGFPQESGLKLDKFNPTAMAVAANGDIFLADGYASQYIFKFDKNGKYLLHFGKAGNGLKEFNTAHGMVLDTRYEPNRLLICDRNHQPKGRLLHYDLDGNFIDEVVTGLGMPTSAAVQGDYVSCTGDWSSSTRATRLLPCSVTTPTWPNEGPTASRRTSGKKASSAAPTDPTGIKTATCTFRTGTFPAAS
jgi:hypothetical protein